MEILKRQNLPDMMMDWTKGAMERKGSVLLIVSFLSVLLLKQINVVISLFEI